MDMFPPLHGSLPARRRAERLAAQARSKRPAGAAIVLALPPHPPNNTGPAFPQAGPVR